MKTAVNYLEDSLKLRKDGGDMYQFCISLDELQEIIEQAKDMEKQQIIDANRNGVDMVIDNKQFITGEQYYNKNFKTR